MLLKLVILLLQDKNSGSTCYRNICTFNFLEIKKIFSFGKFSASSFNKTTNYEKTIIVPVNWRLIYHLFG